MSLTDPILVEVLRGDSVECVHRGAAVVCDAAGRVVFSVGDIEQAIYPRSAIKALQALPLVESGAADRYGFGHAELALACSSHSGEPRHAETAAAMLAKAGLTEATLECGAHWPSGASATQGLARSGGKPSALHNNCSGKHSGFVCFACQEGIDPAGYVGIDHKVQRFVAEAVGEVTGHRLDRETAFGIDGCSIPTFAVPLKKLAHGFAKLATGEGVGPERAKAFAGCGRPAPPSPSWWPARAASAPMSWASSASGSSSRPAPRACSARRCRARASASRSNASMARPARAR